MMHFTGRLSRSVALRAGRGAFASSILFRGVRDGVPEAEKSTQRHGGVAVGDGPAIIKASETDVM
ncbi:hypothetical protein [Streptomyces sp. URMC 125]|uniref:hypothetical protein n=1 Tax=Streptomyces sp. URMC 125 TaxID=3423419 RepID=UPI003F1AB280